MKKTKAIALIACCVAGMNASVAIAQNLDSISQSGDWVVFVDPANAKHCYIASQPKSSKAMRDGQEVDASRGAIYLVTGVKNGATEPTFISGYPLKPEKEVQLKIGGQVFNYFTQPNASAEQAWPAANNDANVIAAMKGGADVQVTAVSQRGTTTIDNFSLAGFTAAFNEAVAKCK